MDTSSPSPTSPPLASPPPTTKTTAASTPEPLTPSPHTSTQTIATSPPNASPLSPPPPVTSPPTASPPPLEPPPTSPPPTTTSTAPTTSPTPTTTITSPPPIASPPPPSPVPPTSSTPPPSTPTQIPSSPPPPSPTTTVPPVPSSPSNPPNSPPPPAHSSSPPPASKHTPPVSQPPPSPISHSTHSPPPPTNPAGRPPSPSQTPKRSPSPPIASPSINGTLSPSPPVSPVSHKSPSPSSSTPSLSVSSSPSSPSANPTAASPISGNGGVPMGGIIAIGLVVGFVMLGVIVLVAFYMSKRKRRDFKHNGGYIVPSPFGSSPRSDSNLIVKTAVSSSTPFVRSSSGSGTLSPHSHGGLGQSRSWFMYQELYEATNGFALEYLLGEGGFGCVYKGVLANGREIAVKQLKIGGSQGEREFQAEVEIISRIHHRHLVSLVGYCIFESKRLLVYEYVPNQTLYYHLHGDNRPVMDWATRIKIVVGAARGIAYLHEDCHPRIIHRDIKSTNILLDDKFEARVADFGLAKLALDVDTHVSTRVMGTFGYMAPEYATSGKLTDKSDVYSFGVVLLELLTGRKPVDASQPLGDESLVEWVCFTSTEWTVFMSYVVHLTNLLITPKSFPNKCLIVWLKFFPQCFQPRPIYARPLLSHALETGKVEGLVDPRLENNYVESELFLMIEASAACVRHSATKRPGMGQAIRAFGGLSPSDLSNGMRVGQSEIYDSAQQSAEIRWFRRMAFGSQDYSTDYFSEAARNTGYPLNPNQNSRGPVFSTQHSQNDPSSQQSQNIYFSSHRTQGPAFSRQWSQDSTALRQSAQNPVFQHQSSQNPMDSSNRQSHLPE
ncbi:hypothetical protein V2J09_003725 [Rumex salicifolius]